MLWPSWALRTCPVFYALITLALASSFTHGDDSGTMAFLSDMRACMWLSWHGSQHTASSYNLPCHVCQLWHPSPKPPESQVQAALTTTENKGLGPLLSSEPPCAYKEYTVPQKRSPLLIPPVTALWLTLWLTVSSQRPQATSVILCAPRKAAGALRPGIVSPARTSAGAGSVWRSATSWRGETLSFQPLSSWEMSPALFLQPCSYSRFFFSFSLVLDIIFLYLMFIFFGKVFITLESKFLIVPQCTW